MREYSKVWTLNVLNGQENWFLYSRYSIRILNKYKKRMIHSLSDIWNASCINALSFHWIKFQVYVCVCIRIIVYLTASVGTHTHIRLLALDIHSEAVHSISLCKTVVGISLWIEIFPRFFIWEKEWENYLKKRIFTLLTSV